MKTKKLNLNAISVKSFITKLEIGSKQTIEGGAAKGIIIIDISAKCTQELTICGSCDTQVPTCPIKLTMPPGC